MKNQQKKVMKKRTKAKKENRKKMDYERAFKTSLRKVLALSVEALRADAEEWGRDWINYQIDNKLCMTLVGGCQHLLVKYVAEAIPFNARIAKELENEMETLEKLLDMGVDAAGRIVRPTIVMKKLRDEMQSVVHHSLKKHQRCLGPRFLSHNLT